jgi:hypothetical protein
MKMVAKMDRWILAKVANPVTKWVQYRFGCSRFVLIMWLHVMVMIVIVLMAFILSLSPSFIFSSEIAYSVSLVCTGFIFNRAWSVFPMLKRLNKASATSRAASIELQTIIGFFNRLIGNFLLCLFAALELFVIGFLMERMDFQLSALVLLIVFVALSVEGYLWRVDEFLPEQQEEQNKEPVPVKVRSKH